MFNFQFKFKLLVELLSFALFNYIYVYSPYWAIAAVEPDRDFKQHRDSQNLEVPDPLFQ